MAPRAQIEFYLPCCPNHPLDRKHFPMKKTSYRSYPTTGGFFYSVLFPAARLAASIA